MMNVKDDIKVYVINLARSNQRRESMELQLENCGINYDFFSAVDGNLIDISCLPQYKRDKRLQKYGGDLTLGELGCYISHYMVLEEILKEKLSRAVILEDDCILSPEFPALVKQLSGFPQDFELIRLSGSRERRSLPVSPMDHGYQLVRLLGGPCTATGYAVSHQGAVRLLDGLREITCQIDCALDRYWEHRVRSFAVTPYPVRPDMTKNSDIGFRSDIWDDPGKGHLKIRRRINKLQDSFWKGIYNLKIRLETVRAQ